MTQHSHRVMHSCTNTLMRIQSTHTQWTRLKHSSPLVYQCGTKNQLSAIENSSRRTSPFVPVCEGPTRDLVQLMERRKTWLSRSRERRVRVEKVVSIQLWIRWMCWWGKEACSRERRVRIEKVVSIQLWIRWMCWWGKEACADNNRDAWCHFSTDVHSPLASIILANTAATATATTATATYNQTAKLQTSPSLTDNTENKIHPTE